MNVWYSHEVSLLKSLLWFESSFAHAYDTKLQKLVVISKCTSLSPFALYSAELACCRDRTIPVVFITFITLHVHLPNTLA